MILALNPLSEVPLFQQLHDRIVEGIARRQIGPGEQLPTVRALASDFGINPATVKKAYDLLKAEGIVATSMREGSVVLQPAEPHPDHVAAFERDALTLLARAHSQGLSRADISASLTQILDGFAEPSSPTDPSVKDDS